MLYSVLANIYQQKMVINIFSKYLKIIHYSKIQNWTKFFYPFFIHLDHFQAKIFFFKSGFETLRSRGGGRGLSGP